MDNLKTYDGGCLCGQVRYRVELDLRIGSGHCTCSLCRQTDYWGALARPEAFRLLAGEDNLRDHSRNARGVHQLSCKRCGMRAFCRGDIPEIGGAYVTVNLKGLDDIDAILADMHAVDAARHDREPAYERLR
jgi:hypothetical protein